MFFKVLVFGSALIILQAIASCFDGFFCQYQMRRGGVSNGTSFLQHGGMWADAFIISPLVASVVSNYKLPYLKWYSFLLGVVILVAIFAFAGKAYARMSRAKPEAHSHGGKTTIAGKIHGAYAAIAAWIMAMFYLTPVDPQPPLEDFFFVSASLTVMFVLGILKFDKNWEFTRTARVQLGSQIVILWAVTAVRIEFF